MLKKDYEELIKLTPKKVIKSDIQLHDFLNNYSEEALLKASNDPEATEFIRAVAKGVVERLQKSDVALARAEVQKLIYRNYVSPTPNTTAGTGLSQDDFPELTFETFNDD